MIGPSDKQKIIEKLNKKFNSQGIKCPMCGNNHFIIADGYFNSHLQDDLKNLSIGGPSIPSIPIICDKCGFISMHALGVLGLLPKQDTEDKKGGEHGK